LGKWDSVAALGDQANRLQFSPEDRSEWIPFLKAYAITGKADQLKQTAKRIVGDKFLRQEPLSPEIEQVIAVNYCKNGAE